MAKHCQLSNFKKFDIPGISSLRSFRYCRCPKNLEKWAHPQGTGCSGIRGFSRAHHATGFEHLAQEKYYLPQWITFLYYNVLANRARDGPTGRQPSARNIFQTRSSRSAAKRTKSRANTEYIVHLNRTLDVGHKCPNKRGRGPNKRGKGPNSNKRAKALTSEKRP